MLWFKFLSKLIKILHSGEDPRQVAAGFALGAIIGLTPILTLHNLAIFILILLLNVSISAAFFGILVFSAFAYLLDTQFHVLGSYILTQIPALQPFWTQLYNMPIAPLTRFYNTVVMGSFVSALIALIPIYFATKHFILLYRTHLAQRVNNLKIVQIIKGSNLVQFYQKIKSMGA
ncbi:MAG TPA: TIGR03546 family protein [Bacillota bacterium]|nr:TIGR03546 family protein [Bacillota bacterium]